MRQTLKPPTRHEHTRRQKAAIGHALASYGATIASFLGAIHRGLAMRDRSDAGGGFVALSGAVCLAS